MLLESNAFLAERVKSKVPKGIHDVNRIAKELVDSGHQVFRLIRGEPDFDTPTHIKKAAEQALARGMTHHILREGHVVSSPGSYYGPGGEGYIRFSYATSLEEIRLGIDGIKKALNKLRK